MAQTAENVDWNNLHFPLKDGERGAAVREQNYPQFTTVVVSCAEVCVFTNILVMDLHLNS